MRRGGRAFQAQPCHQQGGTAPAHPGLYAGAVAPSYCRWQAGMPACPCWSPAAGTTTLVHTLEKGSGIGSGRNRRGLLHFAPCSPDEVVLPWHGSPCDTSDTCNCHPLSPCYVSRCSPHRYFSLKRNGELSGQRRKKFRQGKKANLPNTVSIAAMNISKGKSFKMSTYNFESWQQWKCSPVWYTASSV